MNKTHLHHHSVMCWKLVSWREHYITLWSDPLTEVTQSRNKWHMWQETLFTILQDTVASNLDYFNIKIYCCFKVICQINIKQKIRHSSHIFSSKESFRLLCALIQKQVNRGSVTHFLQLQNIMWTKLLKKYLKGTIKAAIILYYYDDDVMPSGGGFRQWGVISKH